MKKIVLFYEEGTCSLGALISLVWSGHPFYTSRLEDNDTENPDFKKINGMGEVPTLYVDGTVITENSAILPFIAQLDRSKKLTFEEASAERDQLNRALGFLSTSFHKAFVPTFMGEGFHPDKKVQKEIKETVIHGHLKDVIQHAEDHPFDERSAFMYESPMIIDAYLFAMARWAENYYDVEKQFPKIHRFQQAMKKDPAVQLALDIESGKIQAERDHYLGDLEFKSFVKQAAQEHASEKSNSARTLFSKQNQNRPTSGATTH